MERMFSVLENRFELDVSHLKIIHKLVLKLLISLTLPVK